METILTMIVLVLITLVTAMAILFGCIMGIALDDERREQARWLVWRGRFPKEKK